MGPPHVQNKTKIIPAGKSEEYFNVRGRVMCGGGSKRGWTLKGLERKGLEVKRMGGNGWGDVLEFRICGN